MRRPPTTGSFNMAVLTRAVIVASSTVSPAVLPQAVNNSGATSAMTSSIVVEKPNLFISPPPGVRSNCTRCRVGCKLHACGVISRIHHQHFGGDRPPGMAQEEERRISHLGSLDGSPQRRAVAVVLKNRREPGDAGCRERLD